MLFQPLVYAVTGCDLRKWPVATQKALICLVDPWRGEIGMPTSVCAGLVSWLLPKAALRPSLILTLFLR